MARVKNNLFLAGASGRLGNNLILKQYSYGTVLSSVPNMSKVKKSPLQKLKQGNFALAIAYAQSILRDKAKKAAYSKKLPKGKTVYHAAIQEYLRKNKSPNP